MRWLPAKTLGSHLDLVVRDKVTITTWLADNMVVMVSLAGYLSFDFKTQKFGPLKILQSDIDKKNKIHLCNEMPCDTLNSSSHRSEPFAWDSLRGKGYGDARHFVFGMDAVNTTF